MKPLPVFALKSSQDMVSESRHMLLKERNKQKKKKKKLFIGGKCEPDAETRISVIPGH